MLSSLRYKATCNCISYTICTVHLRSDTDTECFFNTDAGLQSTLRKKMVTVHFTTIPCEPNTANRHKESHILGEIRLCTSNIVHARFEVFRTFLYVL